MSLNDAEKSAVQELLVLLDYKISESEATGLLRSSGWDLNEAYARYLDKEGDSSAPTPQPSSSWRAPPRSQPKKRFATFSDLSRNASKEASPVPSDDDMPDNFFTGGEKSGLAVQNPDGPGNHQDGSGRLINDIVRQAQRNAGGPNEEEQEVIDQMNNSDSGRQNRVFAGTGFTLGSDEVPSQTVADESDESSSNGAPRRAVRRLTFWRDGFSVEEGPLFRYDDPANVAHLQAIHSGRAPLSLLDVESGQDISLIIIRKLDEDFVSPKRPLGGFSGEGVRLGSPVPGDVSSAPSPSPAPVSTTAPSSQAQASVAGTGDSLVQIRLASGQALRTRFNAADAVQVLYDYVDSTSSSSRAYVLQTTFPNRELANRKQTLKEAGVVGAVVVQRWT